LASYCLAIALAEPKTSEITRVTSRLAGAPTGQEDMSHEAVAPFRMVETIDTSAVESLGFYEVSRGAGAMLASGWLRPFVSRARRVDRDRYSAYSLTSNRLTRREMARTTKSIRFAQEHQELLKLLAAFEGLSEGELVERALESFIHGRVLAYRKTLGLSRDEVDVHIEDAGELVARLREAMVRAIAEGGHAPTEDEIKAELRQRAEARRERALAEAAVPA